MQIHVLTAPQLFTALSRLTPQEQAKVNEFLCTFLANPAHPGVKLERVNRARSKNVWSARITRDLRAILFKDGDHWGILYAAHHDAAYDWAERREIGRHSVTGALQIVEAVESVREVERIVEVPVQPQAPPLFHDHDDAYLLSLGLPESWLPALRRVSDEDQLLEVCTKLHDDVAERLLAVAAGELVTPPLPVAHDRPLTEAADTRRRFFLVEDAGGLAAALAAPLERWITFLHPSQRALVERDFRGPAKVSGSAGTGKTVVAMHRARHLARQGEQVLFTSFVTTLCDNLQSNLAKLCTADELSRITVSTVHSLALEIVRQAEPHTRPATDDDVRELLDSLRLRHAAAYDRGFVKSEWDNVVRLQGLASWSEYRQARRTGRGRGLAVKERKVLWRVFGGTLDALAERGLVDWPGLCRRAGEQLAAGRATSPYTAVIVDEVQDLKPPALCFLKTLCAKRPGNLMVCGDAGQRIYPGGFSLSALGIEVRGRSAVLRINYRTTEQIRRVADRMLGVICEDMDGGTESRAGTRSLLKGPEPRLEGYASREAEIAAGVAEIRRWLGEGLAPEAIGVFARTGKRTNALGAALQAAEIPWRRLANKDAASAAAGAAGAVQLGTMHRAKGLEFKAVLVLGCSDTEVPNPSALRGVEDPLDREAALERERRLLYVAMTRARDELTLSWSGSPSRFLAGLLDGLNRQEGASV